MDTANTAPAPASKGWLLWVGVAVLIVAGTLAWWNSNSHAPSVDTPSVDTSMSEVLRVNNRGVGLMEQFAYKAAAMIFEEVVHMAPDWRPGHINLGIALLNLNTPESKDRATRILRNVLAKEPNNLHAHFCLGIIFHEQGNIEEAYPHFETVTRLDPQGADAWYFRGQTLPGDARIEQKKEFFEKAVHCDPYLRRAIYGLERLVRDFAEIRRADELKKSFAGLNRIYDEERIRYGEMGKYGEAIGAPEPKSRPPFGPIPVFHDDAKFRVFLKPGSRWARSTDLGQDSAGDLRRLLRQRFGTTLVVVDYDRDGNPDLFLVGAVVENGQVRDLLLHNDEKKGFIDVTHEAGLAEPRPSLGCTVADFDNDGYPDLFISGIGGAWLFRNQFRDKSKTLFHDVTRQGGLDKLQGVCLGSCFVDLDQDSDLDLLVAQYASSPEEALHDLKGKGNQSKGGLVVCLNVGQATAKVNTEDPPPLNPAFQKMGPEPWLGGPQPVVAVAASDLEGDRDPDLLVLSDATNGSAIFNNRLLRLRRTVFPSSFTKPGTWNGALVLDANHDGRSDLFLIDPSRPPVFLVSKKAPTSEQDLEKLFERGPCDSPALLQAQAIDVDNDGWTDIVGLSEKRRPVLLHNRGGKLVHALEGLGSDASWPEDITAVATITLKEDCFPNLLLWSEENGLQMRRNRGNENKALRIELIGHRKVEVQVTDRCNADGIGTWVVVQTADFWTGMEYTTLSAGLGQSRQPLHLGLGRHSWAEVVRLRWPDNVWQAELNKPACRLVRIDEQNRKTGSCPVLFTWDGNRYTFVTDFLGAGTLGEAMPDGQCMQPRPEECVKIEAHQLAVKDGFYVLKVAEPMDEVTYLDQLQLVVVDHPADVGVYPDERFVLAGPPPSQDLLSFQRKQSVFPVKAVDHRGRDVTRVLQKRDRHTVDGFARRAWSGFAEDHWVELDFADQLAHFGPNDRLVLFLAGWTDYAYPESIWAANQAGIALQTPTLERLGPDGKWQTVIADTGFPAGLPRMMTIDLTGKLTGPRCVLRLRTNMTVYWDQAFIAPSTDPASVAARLAATRVRTHVLEVHHAALEKRGFMKEVSPDGRQPTIYDYDQLEPVPFTRQTGFLTRFGEVTELLQSRDDWFAIFGPGDEVTVRFDARRMPSLPKNWQRSFVLRTAGYCKGCGPFTVTGGSIDPLPFHSMSRFPYGPKESYPQSPRHREYLQQYQTRAMDNR